MLAQIKSKRTFKNVENTKEAGSWAGCDKINKKNALHDLIFFAGGSKCWKK